MGIEQAKENWAYAREALADIHPSFKLHLGVPHETAVIGFKEDPYNMFSEFFRGAVRALGERFQHITFDFYNLDDFYSKPLSFDLTQVAREERMPITIKDREERIDSLVVNAEDITLMGVVTRAMGHIYEEGEPSHLQVAFDPESGERRRYTTQNLLIIGAELRGQRVIVDTYSDTNVEILIYDHPADMVPPAQVAKTGETFSEKPN